MPRFKIAHIGLAVAVISSLLLLRVGLDLRSNIGSSVDHVDVVRQIVESPGRVELRRVVLRAFPRLEAEDDGDELLFSDVTRDEDEDVIEDVRQTPVPTIAVDMIEDVRQTPVPTTAVDMIEDVRQTPVPTTAQDVIEDVRQTPVPTTAETEDVEELVLESDLTRLEEPDDESPNDEDDESPDEPSDSLDDDFTNERRINQPLTHAPKTRPPTTRRVEAPPPAHWHSDECVVHRTTPVGRGLKTGISQRARCVDYEITEEFANEPSMSSLFVSITHRLVYVPVLLPTQAGRDIEETMRRRFHAVRVSDAHLLSYVSAPNDVLPSEYTVFSFSQHPKERWKFVKAELEAAKGDDPNRLKHTALWHSLRCYGNKRARLHFDFIGQVERLEDDWKKLLRLANVDFVELVKERRSPVEGTEEEFDCDKALFHKGDFACFGYDFPASCS